jgi:hypothetical protein
MFMEYFLSFFQVISYYEQQKNQTPLSPPKKKEALLYIPRHLLTTEDAEILKNVVLHSVATALASIVCNKIW